MEQIDIKLLSRIYFSGYLAIGSFAMFLKYFVVLIKVKFQKMKIQKCAQLSIKQICELDKNNLKNLKVFQDIRQNKLMVSVGGNVQSQNFIESSLKQNQKLILRMLKGYDIYQGDYIDANQDQIINQSLDQVESFKIQENNQQIQIQNFKESNFQYALQRIAYKRTNYKQSLKDQIYSFFVLLFNLIAQVFKSEKFIWKGFKIGYQEQEFGIKLGSYLNVIGELKYNKQTDMLFIDNPLFLSLSKIDIIKDLDKIIKQNIINIQFWLYLTMGLVGYSYFYYTINKKKQK